MTANRLLRALHGDDSAGLAPVRLDGKTVRGARDSEGNQRHLLVALVGRTAPTSADGPSAAGGYEGATPPRRSQAAAK